MIPLDEADGTYSNLIRVTTLDGEKLRSDQFSARVSSDTLFVWIEGQQKKIPLSTLNEISELKFDMRKTFGLAVGVIAVGGFLIHVVLASTVREILP